MIEPLRKAYHRWHTQTLEALYPHLPVSGVVRPVFLLGCGRSGKSTLARALASRLDAVHLNEARHLWTAVFPEADIWQARPGRRPGRLVLDADDYRLDRARRLSRAFALQARRRGRTTVLDELAINNFRLALIARIFPDARFVHVYRSGLEVAELIGCAARAGRWFGAGDVKWHQLAARAGADEPTRGLPALCRCDRDRGLLEWRLSTEAATVFLADQPATTYREVSAYRLQHDRCAALDELVDFLGESSTPKAPPVSRALSAWVDDRSLASSKHGLSERDRELGGPLLLPSMTDSSGLVSYIRG